MPRFISIVRTEYVRDISLTGYCLSVRSTLDVSHDVCFFGHIFVSETMPIPGRGPYLCPARFREAVMKKAGDCRWKRNKTNVHRMG